jgi:DNA-binding CsgD family transcriptional regulator
METPLITVRLPAEHHGLLREIASLIKAGGDSIAALQNIAGHAREANHRPADRVAIIESRTRSLLNRIEVLEAHQNAGPAINLIDGVPTTERQLRTEVELPFGANRQSPRQRAEELAGVKVPDGRGGLRDLKRAEIEAALIAEFRIPRDSAQSAATKAIQKLDPHNENRRTHNVPVARTVDDQLRQAMQDLADQGISTLEIARRMGAHERTVRRHLARLSRQKAMIVDDHRTDP